MMTRKLVLALVLICVTVLPAAAAGEMKIVYIDLQKALNLSEAGKAAKDKIAQRVKEHETVFDGRQKELKKLKDELEKQALLLSEEARSAKQRDFDQRLKEFQRATKDAQDEVKQKDEDFTRAILEELSKVIQDFGTREGYAMILEKTESAVLYADPKADVTDNLIKAYDASRKK